MCDGNATIGLGMVERVRFAHRDASESQGCVPMPDVDNPYATALDGLELPDPVQSFFDFCIERERIRTRRASGQPGPWSADPIFQQGRFLNVFREDDRGTR